MEDASSASTLGIAEGICREVVSPTLCCLARVELQGPGPVSWSAAPARHKRPFLRPPTRAQARKPTPRKHHLSRGARQHRSVSRSTPAPRATGLSSLLPGIPAEQEGSSSALTNIGLHLNQVRPRPRRSRMTRVGVSSLDDVEVPC